MLRRVYPAVDVRPLDLYKPDNVRKPVWDLKVNHLGREYDVVALFNYSTEDALSRLISWEELGLRPNQVYHVYDFWQGMYLGAWDRGVFLTVPPADVRVVTLVPEEPRPVLLSTSSWASWSLSRTSISVVPISVLVSLSSYCFVGTVFLFVLCVHN